MCFPILKVHSLQKLHDFFGMCFSLFFLFHFPWFQVWTVTISRNSLVLYLAFFVSNSSVQLLLKIHESFNDIFLGVCVLIWGTRRFLVEIVWYIYIYIYIYQIFLTPSALISLFLLGVGDFFGTAFLLCIAWVSSCWEPLQALTVFTKRPLSEDWFPEGSLFVWTLKYFNCKCIFLELPSS